MAKKTSWNATYPSYTITKEQARYIKASQPFAARKTRSDKGRKRK